MSVCGHSIIGRMNRLLVAGREWKRRWTGMSMGANEEPVKRWPEMIFQCDRKNMVNRPFQFRCVAFENSIKGQLILDFGCSCSAHFLLFISIRPTYDVWVMCAKHKMATHKTIPSRRWTTMGNEQQRLWRNASQFKRHWRWRRRRHISANCRYQLSISLLPFIFSHFSRRRFRIIRSSVFGICQNREKKTKKKKEKCSVHNLTRLTHTWTRTWFFTPLITSIIRRIKCEKMPENAKRDSIIIRSEAEEATPLLRVAQTHTHDAHASYAPHVQRSYLCVCKVASCSQSVVSTYTRNVSYYNEADWNSMQTLYILELENSDNGERRVRVGVCDVYYNHKNKL